MSKLFESLDYNFIDAGSNEYYYDAEELTDAKSAAIAFYDSKNYKNRLNVFKGMSSFQAICISPAVLGAIKDNQRATDTTNQSQFLMVKAHVPELHSTIGNPCDVLDLKIAADQKKQAIVNIVKNHPWFVGNIAVQSNSISRLPSFGDIIRISFEKNPSGGRMMYGIYKGIVYSSNINSIEDECKETLAESFNSLPILTLGNTSSPLTSNPSQPAAQTLNSSVIDFSNSLKTPSLAEYVYGNEFTGLTAIVEAELAIWKNKKENDPSVFDVLKKYWDNVGWKPTSWTPTGTPWSAAYISYVITRIDPSFPKSANHNSYALEANKGTGGWTAWKADKTKKYKAQIGDILIYARPEGGPQASHGDTVYKIQNKIAYLSGGNLADSALGGQVFLQLPLDDKGFYSNFKQYITILKKNGRLGTL